MDVFFQWGREGYTSRMQKTNAVPTSRNRHHNGLYTSNHVLLYIFKSAIDIKMEISKDDRSLCLFSRCEIFRKFNNMLFFPSMIP